MILNFFMPGLFRIETSRVNNDTDSTLLNRQVSIALFLLIFWLEIGDK